MNINFLIGTKAQFIKCIPVINEAINRSINVSLYDLKQHAQTTDTLKLETIKSIPDSTSATIDGMDSFNNLPEAIETQKDSINQQ